MCLRRQHRLVVSVLYRGQVQLRNENVSTHDLDMNATIGVKVEADIEYFLSRKTAEGHYKGRGRSVLSARACCVRRSWRRDSGRGRKRGRVIAPSHYVRRMVRVRWSLPHRWGRPADRAITTENLWVINTKACLFKIPWQNV